MESLIAEYPADGFILEAPARRRIVSLPPPTTDLSPGPRCCAMGLPVLESRMSAPASSSGDRKTPRGLVERVLNGPGNRIPGELAVADNPPARCVCSLFVSQRPDRVETSGAASGEVSGSRSQNNQ
jgi:hypothetical protein